MRIFDIGKTGITALALSSVVYVFISTLRQIIFEVPFQSGKLFLAILLILLVLIHRLNRGETALKITLPTGALLLFGLILLIYRSTSYVFSYDDLVFHSFAGHFIGSMWTGSHFMPLDFPTFLYPLLQVPFYFLSDAWGFKATILFLSILQLFWFVDLTNRFSLLIFPGYTHKQRIVSLVFLAFYFVPELVATHVTFSSDLYAVLFALEAAYLFMTGKKYWWMTVLMLIAVFTKQSSGLFILPVFLFMIFSQRKAVSLRQMSVVLCVLFMILFYHVVLFVFTGNPFAFLLNGVFRSPLYGIDNFRDWRWGPLGLADTLVWPAVGSLSHRYGELSAAFKFRYFFAIFGAGYIGSLIAYLKTKKTIFLVLFLSYILWAWQSGYGRYQLALVAMSLPLLINVVKKHLPGLTTVKTILITIFISFLALASFRIDVGQRGFWLESYFPPKISSYFSQQFKQGLALYFHDRPYDLISNEKLIGEYKSVVVAGRGKSTFYAYLLSRSNFLPVYQYITQKSYEEILNNKLISEKVRLRLLALGVSRPILLLADNNQAFAVSLDESFLSPYECEKLVTDDQSGLLASQVDQYICN